MNKSGPKISVLTPSIRPQYLDITQKCLENQTFQDFEWLTEIDCRNKGYQLPTAMNRMLTRANGEIVVILQDCITIPDNFLQHVVDHYDPQVCVTYPMGKKDGETIKWDWRKASLRAEKPFIEPHCWETDVASAPLKAFRDVGGYDEEYCNGWSWENVEIAHRMAAAGYKFTCDNEVETIGIDHDREIENPFRNKLENNDKRANNTRILAEAGDYKMPYIRENLLMQLSDIVDRCSIVQLKVEHGSKESEKELEKLMGILNGYKDERIWTYAERLYRINGQIWELESDIRRGKEAELGLEEVGRRALQIRDFKSVS